jgi:excisionase family DNA binding protein
VVVISWVAYYIGLRREGRMVVDVQTKDVLNAEEAAEFLGFNPYTIREKARLGEIPGRKLGREWRFSRRQLLKWVEEGDRQGVRA